MNFHQSLLEVARELRKNQTPAERILWGKIRNRKLGGFKFYRQKPIDRYIADFYCPLSKIVVELDGPVHLSSEQRERDEVRDEIIQQYGICILRFKNSEVCSNADRVLRIILDACQKQSHRSSPLSSERRGG